MGKNRVRYRGFCGPFGVRSTLGTFHWTVLLPILCGALTAAEEAKLPASTPQETLVSDADATDSSVTKAVRDPIRPYRPRLNDVRPLSLQDVTPGRTSVDLMLEQMGEPIDRRRAGTRTTYSYRTGPFEKVEIDVVEDLVSSITLRLLNAPSAAKTEAELGLDSFSTAMVYDEHGEPLGVAYPERGVTLVFADTQRRVGHVVVDPILPEPFILRAEQDSSRQYEWQLADLEYAIKVHSASARAYGLRAKRLASLGQHVEALAAIETAIRLAPGNAAYRLTRAGRLFEQQAYREAVLAIEGILDEESTPPVVRARAECCLGDMLADGPHQDVHRAMQHHMAAIQLATPLGTDRRVSVRREAKRVLIDAYLAAAKDVAAGDWRRKETTIPKWLEGAEKLAEGMRLHDGGDETLRFLVLRKSVAAYAELGGDVDVEAPIDVALQEAERLLAVSSDALYRTRLRREMAKLMFDAALFERLRVPGETARERVGAAVAAWEAIHTAGNTTPRDEALIGRLYFYMGSTYAAHDQDHQEAVRWYERAIPLLNRTAPDRPSRWFAHHGERLVSMGVSYWQVGTRDEAVKLTRDGLQMMQTASHNGFIQERALAVPYGNLASMYETMGKPEEARKMAVLAAKLEHSEAR
ncbi:MAG: hypothetical protein ACC628_06430 [Pirellulaceae bacterium]